jgi:hypothetical protein
MGQSVHQISSGTSAAQRRFPDAGYGFAYPLHGQLTGDVPPSRKLIV